MTFALNLLFAEEGKTPILFYLYPSRPSYLSSYSASAEKAARLMLGPGHSMVVSVSGLTVVHAAHGPLLVTILADPGEAMIGQILEFAK